MDEKEKQTIQKEVDPDIPDHIVDQYAGESIDELRSIEQANQQIARDVIPQANENS